MSNTSPSLASISRPAVIFGTLLLVLGALVLASSNIAPESTRRPQTALPATIPPDTSNDPFASLEYSAFQASEGLLSAEAPTNWERRENASGGALGYIITPPNNSGTIGIQTAALPTSRIQGAPQNATLRDYLRLVVEADKLPYDDSKVRDVKAGALSGLGLKQNALQSNDPRTGQSVSLDRDLWVLELDKTHILIVSAVSPTEDWAKMQAVVERFTQTLKVDVEKAIPVIDRP